MREFKTQIIKPNYGKRVLLVDDARSDDNIGVRCTMIARDYDAAAFVLQAEWDEIYLDHDLGIGQTGYDVACLIEELVHSGKMKLPEKIACVSANPSGRERIELVISKLYGTL